MSTAFWRLLAAAFCAFLIPSGVIGQPAQQAAAPAAGAAPTPRRVVAPAPRLPLAMPAPPQLVVSSPPVDQGPQVCEGIPTVRLPAHNPELHAPVRYCYPQGTGLFDLSQGRAILYVPAKPPPR
jgi:hypothetical protein